MDRSEGRGASSSTLGRYRALRRNIWASSTLSFGTSVFWYNSSSRRGEGDQNSDPEPGEDNVPTVLVADDDDDIRSAIVEALQEETDCNVVEAKNGAEALALALSVKLNAMVLDQGMPGLSGSDVVERLRAHDTPPPIILITAAKDARRLANELGLKCVLGKPFSVHQLTALVSEALAGHC
jgi:two-component system, response regulator, stage 0 sporulation protein F